MVRVLVGSIGKVDPRSLGLIPISNPPSSVANTSQICAACESSENRDGTRDMQEPIEKHGTLNSTHDSETTERPEWSDPVPPSTTSHVYPQSSPAMYMPAPTSHVDLASQTFLGRSEGSMSTGIPLGESKVPLDMKSFSGVVEGSGHSSKSASVVDLRPKVPWSSARAGEASKRRSLNLSSHIHQPQLHRSMSIPGYGNHQFPIAEINLGTSNQQPSSQLPFGPPRNASRPMAMNSDGSSGHQIPFAVSETLPAPTSVDVSHQLYRTPSSVTNNPQQLVPEDAPIMWSLFYQGEEESDAQES